MSKTGKLEFRKRKIGGFTGNQLKLIACFSMLCDHIGFMLIENGVLYGQNPDYWELAIATETGHRWYLLACALRMIGRISFPIFAFLLVEGFQHTKNLRSYMRNVALCALLSEVPFDLACFHTLYYPYYQNVCFTLFLGLLSMYLMKRFGRRKTALQLLIAAFVSLLGFVFRCDYGAFGVGMISVLWILRKDPPAQKVIGAVMAAIESQPYFCSGALGFLAVRFYNGKRGDFPLKYFFYFFYPLHMLLFYAMVYVANAV